MILHQHLDMILHQHFIFNRSSRKLCNVVHDQLVLSSNLGDTLVGLPKLFDRSALVNIIYDRLASIEL